MNKVTLIGNVANDLELKTYKNDNREGVYVTFSLAINTYSKNKEDNRVDFIRIVAFDKRAETLVEYVKKGDRLGVGGSIRTSSYLNDNGEKRYSVEILLSESTFIENNSKRVVNESTIDEEIISEEVLF